MPNAEDDPLSPDLARRLRAALDGVTPPGSAPRYLFAPAGGVSVRRFAPAGLAVAAVALFTLSAFAATGSPNPAVWTERAVTVIESSQTTPARPSPSPESGRPAAAGVTSPTAEPAETPGEHNRPEPSESPEAPGSPETNGSPESTETPEPSQSPEPSGGGSDGGSDGGSGSGSGSGESTPSPSASPSD